MSRGLVILFGSLVLACCTAVGAEDRTKAPDEYPLYKGFATDQALLRKTMRLPQKPVVNASSPEACHAAQRIFKRIPFLFRTRAEVLKLLGDPATVSDYGQPAKASSSLVYIFDTGFGGLQYTLTFDRLDVERVIQIRVDSRN